MLNLDQYLKIARCPFCAIDNPNLSSIAQFNTAADNGGNPRRWRAYQCARCGGVVVAYAMSNIMAVADYYPRGVTIDDILPEKVKAYLQQAIDSVFAPAGSVMLCASSVDAMLKEKGLKEGSLYTRINQAVTQGWLTPEMSTWAHQVRLDANDQRHADEDTGLPTVEDAKQAIEFTKTLSEFLFVLPSKVTRGIQATGATSQSQTGQ